MEDKEILYDHYKDTFEQQKSYLEKRDIYELANTDEMSFEIQSLLSEGKLIQNCLNQYKFETKNEEEIIRTFEGLMEKKA